MSKIPAKDAHNVCFVCRAEVIVVSHTQTSKTTQIVYVHGEDYCLRVPVVIMDSGSMTRLVSFISCYLVRSGHKIHVLPANEQQDQADCVSCVLPWRSWVVVH